MASARIEFESVTPVLPVENVARAVDWFRNVLGFQIGWTWGDPPVLASMCRDRAEVNLMRREPSGPLAPSRVYFCVSEIDALYVQVTQAGAGVANPIDDRDYGMRDFALRDPDNNELHFGQATRA